MSRDRRWPPDRVLWALVVTAVGAALLLDRLAPEAPWPAVILAGGLAVAAVLGQRWLRRHAHGEVASTRVVRRPDVRDAGALIERRPLLLRVVVGLAAALGLGGLTALLRFGPRRDHTPIWRDGVRLLDPDGQPLRPEDLVVGGNVTVWPEGGRNEELAAVLLLRLMQPVQAPTHTRAAIDGSIVAYSRICTHAGCPVALFRAEEGTLYCPCHQATFDAVHGATPVFGPASRPLAQLPLGVDDDGYIVAQGDFLSPPGPVGGSG